MAMLTALDGLSRDLFFKLSLSLVEKLLTAVTGLSQVGNQVTGL
ncbi:MAG: hypothetical protein HLUCCO16_22065 [Phormidium sp. OSCR]|nr:MAG: hypothetical protein HLUCCO16_22065 [Phormidium sp. OSCR]